MWKKDEEQGTQSTVDTETRPQPSRAPASPGARATIGPSISIKGDVTGSEDLLIQGKVDGSVTLDLHAVSVGGEGRVNANITGRIITIEGSVEGDLTAQEQIILRGSARVQGDIKAPRVVLEDGATFRGLVDMGAARSAKTAERGAEVKAVERPNDAKPTASPTTGTGKAPAASSEKPRTTTPDRARA